jgi:hypothetical protein
MTGLSQKTAVANVGASVSQFGRGLPGVYTESLTGLMHFFRNMEPGWKIQ